MIERSFALKRGHTRIMYRHRRREWYHVPFASINFFLFVYYYHYRATYVVSLGSNESSRQRDRHLDLTRDLLGKSTTKDVRLQYIRNKNVTQEVFHFSTDHDSSVNWGFLEKILLHVKILLQWSVRNKKKERFLNPQLSHRRSKLRREDIERQKNKTVII